MSELNETQLDLIHRYLDGVITDQEFGSLEQLLRKSKQARATLRSLATIDAKWQQFAEDELLDGNPTRQRGTGSSNEQNDESLADASGYLDSRRSIPMWLALTTIAASLVVGAFGWFRGLDKSRTETTPGIAKVIRIDGTRGDFAAGDELFTDQQLTLADGLIEMAFRETGVHMIATAPLSMRLDSDQRITLEQGQVKLVVPPQGVGFVVDTAQKKFVDLGTSFVVTADAKGSKVLVLDGQISVDDHEGTTKDLMHEGEFARYDRDGKLKKRSASRESLAMPELTFAGSNPGEGSLNGQVFGYDPSNGPQKMQQAKDVIGSVMLPLIESKFADTACLTAFKQSGHVGFHGIGGAYHMFTDRSGLAPYDRDGGWMAWYHGKVRPPQSGRYRFWGYADNHLMVAIDGKPVFEGSRRESHFKHLGIPRTNNPALPCLIARAGFANSDWIALSGDPVQLDILFGEVGGNITSGLLLVEREGEAYEETFWGQPRWPLFLTEAPTTNEAIEFKRLLDHLEQRTMGSFSVSEEAVWKVAE